MGETTKAPPCIDCDEPLTAHPFSEKYGAARGQWSAIYLCPRCRSVKYTSEAHAMARILAGVERARLAKAREFPEVRP